MTEIPVPDKAIRELDNYGMDERTAAALNARTPLPSDDYIRAIARPVLAAFLREQVEATRYDGGFDDAHALHLAEMLDLGWL